MRYKVIAADDETYADIVRYLGAHQPGNVKVRLPNRRMISVEDPSASTITALKKLGARVSEEYQFSVDRTG